MKLTNLQIYNPQICHCKSRGSQTARIAQVRDSECQSRIIIAESNCNREYIRLSNGIISSIMIKIMSGGMFYSQTFHSHRCWEIVNWRRWKSRRELVRITWINKRSWRRCHKISPWACIWRAQTLPKSLESVTEHTQNVPLWNRNQTVLGRFFEFS